MKPTLTLLTALLLASFTTLPAADDALFMNEDAWHYFVAAPEVKRGKGDIDVEVMHPEFALTKKGLENYIDEIARGHVTHFLMNLNTQRANFPSKTLEPVWKSLDEPERYQLDYIRAMKALYESGVDPYKVWIDRCRVKGIQPWISIRMNDLHVTDDPKSPEISTFWHEHPEYRLGRKSFDGGLDYTFEPVRRRMLDFITEVLDRYDPDGLELDLIRFPRYLPFGREKEGATVFTAYLREIRKVVNAAAAKRGHKITLSVRLQPKPAESRNLGMEADVWAKEGLVDLIVPCNHWASIDFDIPLAEWRTWTGDKVAIIPGADSGITENGKRRLATLEEYRRWAAIMRERGAKSFYLFNLFMHPQDGPVWNGVLSGGLAPPATLGAADAPKPSGADLPASIRPNPEWSAQAAKDEKQDFTSIPFDGTTPNKLACDTTLRELPDGSWVMAMLGGGDTEPLPENHVLLTRSHDKGKTWSPMQPLDFGFPREGDTIAMVPSELMVRAERCTLFFATHDGTFAGWKEWMTHSEDSCLTWSKPAPAPGRLHDRTFIRNHILTKDGRILLPFQHYKRVKETKTIAGGRRLSEPTDSRNGVLMSADGGKTWTEHGDIRISKDDTYYGWAENNIVELADGRIAMIIRADGLGGALYYAESNDGGKTWPEFAVKSDIPNPGSKATLYPLGGDTVALLHNPNPKGRHPLALWISFDGMKTWPYQRVLVEHSSDGPGRSLNYPDGFVSKDKQWLHFAYDDNRDRAVHYSAKLPPLAALPAADAPKPAVKVTQELLNSIHITPKLIFDPMPAYGEKYLPFAMAASMESTKKGRLWTCWAGGEDGPNAYLLASYSDDQGKSWRDPVFVIDPQVHLAKTGVFSEASYTVSTGTGSETRKFSIGTRLGSFWCDPQGRLWLFFHQSVGMFDGSCSNWFVRCDDPDAEKPVWTEPVYIGFGASLNKPIVRQNGEWILPVSLWERWHIDKPFADCYRELDAVRGSNVFVSDDEGGHWRYRGGIIYKDSCFNEHTVAELNDGRLWMLSRGMKETFQSFSADGGKTWEPQSIAFPHVNSKAVIRRLQSGHLLVIRHGQDITKATPARQELTAFLTTDEGKTWSGKLLLDERDNVSYPDIAQAPNGDIYIHYDRDRYGAAEILFARFREEDVQAGKLISKDAALKNLVKSRQLGMNRGGPDGATSARESK